MCSLGFTLILVIYLYVLFGVPVWCAFLQICACSPQRRMAQIDNSNILYKYISCLPKRANSDVTFGIGNNNIFILQSVGHNRKIKRVFFFLKGLCLRFLCFFLLFSFLLSNFSFIFLIIFFRLFDPLTHLRL